MEPFGWAINAGWFGIAMVALMCSRRWMVCWRNTSDNCKSTIRAIFGWVVSTAILPFPLTSLTRCCLAKSSDWRASGWRKITTPAVFSSSKAPRQPAARRMGPHGLPQERAFSKFPLSQSESHRLSASTSIMFALTGKPWTQINRLFRRAKSGSNSTLQPQCLPALHRFNIDWMDMIQRGSMLKTDARFPTLT